MTYIDLYCERVDPSFWAEPFNAASNAAFILAALYGFNLRKQRGNGDIWESIVLTLALLIGIGSFLFHTFANSWSAVTDVLPIWSFVAAYTLLALYRGSGRHFGKVFVTLVIGLMMVVRIARHFTTGEAPEPNEDPLLNGSLQYLPAVLIFGAFATFFWLRDHPAKRIVVLALAVFLVSLTLRTIDIATCDATKIGTHFLWHILNATMIALILRALILHMPPRIAPQKDTP